MRDEGKRKEEGKKKKKKTSDSLIESTHYQNDMPVSKRKIEP